MTFVIEQDYAVFLAIAAEVFDELDIELIAYCLMGNHYHLVVRSKSGNLSLAMQRLIGRYTRYFNDKHDLSGALFCGRFRSATVKSRRQLFVLIRYVHRNPQDLPWVRDLAAYRWSSLGVYMNQRRCPTWLKPLRKLALHKPGFEVPRPKPGRRHTHLPRQGKSPMYPRNFEALFARAVSGPQPGDPTSGSAVPLRRLP